MRNGMIRITHQGSGLRHTIVITRKFKIRGKARDIADIRDHIERRSERLFRKHAGLIGIMENRKCLIRENIRITERGRINRMGITKGTNLFRGAILVV